MEFQDYYELLDVPKDASASEIKTAFRKMARKYHPDVAEDKDKEAAEEQFKKINEAYEVLSDPKKRAKYDQLGENWDGRQGGMPGGGFPGGGGMGGFDFGGTGFSDFFESFLGGGGGAGGGSPFGGPMGGMGGQPQARKGSDIEGRIMVSLQEANEGSVREITLSRPDGAGRESLKVKVPVGVEHGQRLRVSGRGNPGMGGGAAGDLYLVISIARHPDFELEGGGDLVHECELEPHRLVLGGKISVPTLSGSVTLKVAECSQPGTRLRLGGRGMAKPGGGNGDLYVELVAKFPEELDEGAKGKWEAFE